MENEQKLANAKAVYETVCAVFTSRNWNFMQDDKELTVGCGVQGTDLPINIMIAVRPNSQLLSLYSPLKDKVPDERLPELSLALSAINNSLLNGSFDLDLSTGQLCFRMCSSFWDSQIGPGLMDYMLDASVSTVDKYNHKLWLLANGVLTFEQLLAELAE